MTRLQETYNAIREHFTQPDAVLAKLSWDEQKQRPGSPICVYRKDGDPKSPVRCSVGVRIPDEMYVPQMDKEGSLDGLLTGFPELMPVMGIATDEDGRSAPDDPVLEFLHRAQEAHDVQATFSTGQFIAKLDTIARDMRLEVPA